MAKTYLEPKANRLTFLQNLSNKEFQALEEVKKSSERNCFVSFSKAEEEM